MVGTVSNGLNTGTASGMPKGMGKVSPAAPATSSSMVSKAAQAGPLGTPPKMKPLLGGMEPVRPKMQIAKTPSPMKPENISLASAYPAAGDVLGALGYGPELGTVALLSKEGAQGRILRVIQAVDELEAAKTAGDKLPVLLKLAALRQESIDAATLRMSLI